MDLSTVGSRPRVVGLDLSPRGTGLVELDDLGRVDNVLFFSDTKKHIERWEGEQFVHPRLSRYVSEYDEAGQLNRTIETTEDLLAFIARLNPAYVAMEQLPFSSIGKHRDQAYWLHALMLYGLTSGGLAYAEKRRPLRYYRPPDVKMFATGKGNALKPHMVAAADGAGFDCSRFGDPGEDLADAYWIARMLQTELLLREGRLQKLDLDGGGMRAFFPEPKKPKRVKEGEPAKKAKAPAPTYLERPFISITRRDVPPSEALDRATA